MGLLMLLLTALAIGAAAYVGLAIGGIPGVFLAAFVVKSLPLQWLYWLVVVVVLYAATLMLRSAMQPQPVLAGDKA